MKVLLVDSLYEQVGGNIIGALLYLGLCDEIGFENVIDWRRSPPYYAWAQDPRISTPWTDAEVFSRINEFDLVIIASPKNETIDLVEHLFSNINRNAIQRLVLTDGEDYSQVRWDLVERFAPSAYFKVSTTANPWPQFLEEKKRIEHTVRLIPFAMATTIIEPPPLPTKDVDISILGGNHFYGVRREGVVEDRPIQKPIYEQRLRDEFPGRHLITGNLPYDEFVDVLARSRIYVGLGGHGIEPLRTYQAMSCKDTMLVRWDCRHIAPVSLTHNLYCATFTTIDEMVSLVRHYLDHDEERLNIARAGNELLRAHYTPRARARHLITEAMR